ncbi:MAG: hypothetical protein LBQ83_07450 [Candidatus Margulisbacteria bacterium]|jgi:transcriptional regulator with AAA-type ATPase domain|nr:hypothetical protein [Candidatus Margulisiibacteriota bacterium]
MINPLLLDTVRGLELWLTGGERAALGRQIQSAAGEPRILIIGGRGTEKEAVARRIACLSRDAVWPEESCLVRYLQEPEDLEDISFLNAAVGGYAVFGDCAFFTAPVQQQLKLLLLNNPLDVKFIFLASARLRPAVLEGRFDEGLYRLILGKELYLPALSERENFAEICQNLLEELNRQYGYKADGLAPETLIALSRREWPGNIEQLRAVLYLLAAQTKTGVITL